MHFPVLQINSWCAVYSKKVSRHLICMPLNVYKSEYFAIRVFLLSCWFFWSVGKKISCLFSPNRLHFHILGKRNSNMSHSCAFSHRCYASLCYGNSLCQPKGSGQVTADLLQTHLIYYVQIQLQQAKKCQQLLKQNVLYRLVVTYCGRLWYPRYLKESVVSTCHFQTSRALVLKFSGSVRSRISLQGWGEKQ